MRLLIDLLEGGGEQCGAMRSYPTRRTVEEQRGREKIRRVDDPGGVVSDVPETKFLLQNDSIRGGTQSTVKEVFGPGKLSYDPRRGRKMAEWPVIRSEATDSGKHPVDLLGLDFPPPLPRTPEEKTWKKAYDDLSKKMKEIEKWMQSMGNELEMRNTADEIIEIKGWRNSRVFSATEIENMENKLLAMREIKFFDAGLPERSQMDYIATCAGNEYLELITQVHGKMLHQATFK